MSQYHNPVMLNECLRYLNLRKGGVYVDATLGGGGHSLAMLQSNPEIKLYGFDQDIDAIEQAGQVLNAYQDQVELIHCNFKNLRTQLALRKVKAIDGILFDLGVSSHQFDDKSRGFSFEAENPLDMRMDRRIELTAQEIVNTLGVNELSRIFKEYGEELYAGRIARAIEQSRLISDILSTKDLSDIIESAVRGNPKDVIKSKARIFQSLRIHLNDELPALERALVDSINILAPGGRIVALSYHSLEDRYVKQQFRIAAKGCDCPPRALKCNCNKKSILHILTNKPILASEEEVKQNSRARSAKLRAGERLSETDTRKTKQGRRYER